MEKGAGRKESRVGEPIITADTEERPRAEGKRMKYKKDRRVAERQNSRSAEWNREWLAEIGRAHV